MRFRAFPERIGPLIVSLESVDCRINITTFFRNGHNRWILYPEGSIYSSGLSLRECSVSLAKIDVKITTQNSHFSNFQYIHLPSCIPSIPIPLLTLVTQLSKSVEKNWAYYGLLNFWNKHFMPL